MKTKDIFEMVNQSDDLSKEAKILDELVYEIEGSINSWEFLYWKYRGLATSIYDFRSRAHISRETLDYENIDKNTFLSLVQYSLNIAYLASIHKKQNDAVRKAIYRNSEALLESLCYKIELLDSKDGHIVILQSNPEAIVVAENTEDDDISRDIIRYNYYDLKDDLHEKRKILTQIFKEYENIKPKLKQYNDAFKKDLGEMFNAFGIRHLKSDNKITNELVLKMTREEKVEWCDKIYKMFLFAKLYYDYGNLKDEIKYIKTGNKKECQN